MSNVGAVVNTAVALGANVVSNSCGGSESCTGAAYSHPGVAITASTGDSGNVAARSPASYPSVIVVAGTSLTRISPRAETAWSGAGSYCSTAFAATLEQVSYGRTQVQACGSRRGATGIFSDAGPNNAVAVYGSFTDRGQTGWLVFALHGLGGWVAHAGRPLVAGKH